MFCGNCGKSIADTVARCPYCGEPTGAPEPVTSGSAAGSAAAAVLQKIPRLTHPKLESGIAGFVRPVLKALEEGAVIRTIMALVFRVVGVLSVLAALYLAIEISKLGMQSQQAQATVGSLLFALLTVVWGATAFLITFYRAASLGSLEDSPFTVIPIVSIWLRAMGEVWAASLILFGIGGCLFVWLTGFSPSGMLGGLAPLGADLSGNGPFLDGIKLLFAGAIGGFAALLVSYAIAEFIIVIVDIALSVRTLVGPQQRA